jgi:DNA-binding transcriptional regulator YiaG
MTQIQFPTTLGERIFQARKGSGMKQALVARHLDVTQQCVSKWETGTTTPTTKQLRALATLFETSTDRLLGISDNARGN